MATEVHVKGKAKWENVELDPKLRKLGKMTGVICLQELKDYKIISGNSVYPSEEQKNSVQETQLSKANLNKKEKRKTVGKFSKNSYAKYDTKESTKVKEKKSPRKGKAATTVKTKTSRKRKLKEKTSLPSVSKKPKFSDDAEDPSPKIQDMSAWRNLFVPDTVMRGLSDLCFTAPTPIQTLTLPSAIRDRMDIVGAAETGSGKTLAFGIPLLHHILKYKEDHGKRNVDRESSKGQVNTNDTNVISVPAIAMESGSEDEPSGDEEYDLPPDEDEENYDIGENQTGCVRVVNHVVFDWLDQKPAKSSQEASPLFALILTPTRELAIQVKNHLKAAAKYTDIKVIEVVGGLAPQKQEKLLRRCPEIVVATPGRLWEMIRQGHPHLSKIQDVHCLVIDEADRMVEKGHFQELTQLLELINSDARKQKKRQNFVFSATLTMIHGGPNRFLTKKKREKLTAKHKIDSLLEKVGISKKPKVVDLTKKDMTAERLTETRITCSMEDKDLYLYYIFHRYPGRTLVFSNSKDCVRRLVTVFTLLNCQPLSLHSDMQQRQRLKKLDKFKAKPHGLLFATDVAARGLDIPDVQHVIHYQVPKTTENYVHRSGRTARALKEGLSVMLIGPEDQQFYKRIVKTLNRDEHLPVFPTEEDYLAGIRDRVQLARHIDKEQHRVVRKKVQNDWLRKAADEMDIELDEDQLHDLGDDREQSVHRQKLRTWKSQLTQMLQSNVVSKQFSGKYPTKTGRLELPYNAEPSCGAVDVAKVEKTEKKHKKKYRPSKPSKRKKISV